MAKVKKPTTRQLRRAKSREERIAEITTYNESELQATTPIYLVGDLVRIIDRGSARYNEEYIIIYVHIDIRSREVVRYWGRGFVIGYRADQLVRVERRQQSEEVMDVLGDLEL